MLGCLLYINYTYVGRYYFIMFTHQFLSNKILNFHDDFTDFKKALDSVNHEILIIY